MKLFVKEGWRYAILLIILFAIATLAVKATITHIETMIAPEEAWKVSALLAILTMGFMLIAGAFGLWAIEFAAEGESRRRLSEVVDSMGYLSDGLLALDRRGRVTGANPAARDTLPIPIKTVVHLASLFPDVAEEDVRRMLKSSGPQEILTQSSHLGTERTYRLRSQPVSKLFLLLVSDVTAMRAQQMRHEQITRLHLIGRVARGVAHDFNTILDSISGHASLLRRLKPGTIEMDQSLKTITEDADRGAQLAEHLVELSHSGVSPKPTDRLAEHVNAAADLLRVGLSDAWKVETDIEPDFPPIALSPIQLEQVILNLGLLAADALPNAGTVRITANKPGTGHLLNVSSRYTTVIAISAGDTPGSDVDAPQGRSIRINQEAGVIESVVHSIIEEAGGMFDSLTQPGATPIYRIALPPTTIAPVLDEAGETLPDEFQSYVAKWQVLLARSSLHHDSLEARLHEIGVRTARVDNIVSALSKVEGGQQYDALLLDKNLLGAEADGLLKAIVKLCPNAGIVVLSDDPDREPTALQHDMAFISSRANPNVVLKAMIEAKSLAVQRQRK